MARGKRRRAAAVVRLEAADQPRDSENSQKSQHRSNVVAGALGIIFCASLLLGLQALFTAWEKPILEAHGFRQTQTAIGVFSMLQGGPLLRYETPVLGPPWSIPFEFPFYQWTAVLMTKVTSLPLDQAGRLTSILYFLGVLGCMYLILGELGVKRVHRLAPLSLLLASPQYVFWSGTFLIESAAVCLGALCFWLGLRAIRNPAPGPLLLAGGAAALASVVKITTSMGFIAGLGLFWIPRALEAWREKDPGLKKSALLRQASLAVAIFLIPLVFTAGWTRLADSLKHANPIASGWIESAALSDFNFGTLAQKLNRTFWLKIVLTQEAQAAIGFSPLLLVLVAAFWERRLRGLILGAFGLFLAVPLVFTNLHQIHDYYACANCVFLVTAFGLLICSWLERGQARFAVAGLVLLLATLSFQRIHYVKGYRRFQLNNTLLVPAVAKLLKERVPQDQVVLTYGLDWNPTIAYYAERRMIMDKYTRSFRQPPISESLRLLRESGQKIGAILHCEIGLPDSLGKTPEIPALAKEYGLSSVPSVSYAECKVYFPVT